MEIENNPDVSTQRNHGIDILKFFCAFLVLLGHTGYPGKIYIDPFVRIAVPVFFMVTGFFYEKTASRGKCIKQIKKVLIIIAISDVLYVLKDLFTCIVIDHTTIREALICSLPVSFKDWIGFIFFNESKISGHLWYLYAILYVLVLFLILNKKKNIRSFYPLIPILLIFNFIMGNYCGVIFHYTVPLIFSRNFLFVGVPFFLLGHWIYTHYNHKQNNIVLAALLLLTCITVSAENIFLLNSPVKGNWDCFISTPFTAYFVFLLVINNKNIFENKVCRTIANWGGKYSLFVYILHPLIKPFIRKGLKIIKLYDEGNILSALSILILTFAASAFCGFIFLSIKNAICKRKKRSKRNA